jgi:hypothetical protein
MKKAVQENEFLVQVVRPVFEMATIRVRAGSEEEAQLLAIEQATRTIKRGGTAFRPPCCSLSWQIYGAPTRVM